jgi:hypothetical protein
MNETTERPADDGDPGAPQTTRSTKGYSADPGPPVRAPEGAIPLAEVPDPAAPIRVPERDDHVQPTGRAEPGDYTPNDRLMGADR